ncbi:hypothetical protein ACHHV8_01980 [Paenibacillus sp. TAB 01]|uniref:hypothetical protein n=1 Tax=Paenibacillus sp. TAB 01 TaxID=3368988 RepID=UPI003753695B
MAFKSGDGPASASPNPLPVELMGCLLILFYHQYQSSLPVELKSELNVCFVHLYQSSVYRHPLEQIHHHEAKHTALKLLLGHQFDDQGLLEQGIEFAKRQLQHIQTFGFKEYGALPWHWHWIQAFTCVWEIVEHPEARLIADRMLEALWQLRAHYYLKGAWVGAQSRQWPHDGPKDNNTLLDYIQFGDFPMPELITRLEGAGLYNYTISDEVKKIGMHLSGPVEEKRLIRFAGADGTVTEEAHTYVYITPDYAVGGIWERRDEFDNEQQRWDVTLPLTDPSAQAGVNQAFFFHPGAKYKPGDDRHASRYGEVLLHKDTAMQLWAAPSGGAAEDIFPTIIGCLPKGEWRFIDRSGYGRVGNIYLAFHLMHEFTIEEKADRVSISSPLVSGKNGVAIEALSVSEAKQLGIHNVQELADKMQTHRASFTTETDADGCQIAYVTRRGEALSLHSARTVSIHGKPVDWSGYTISG